MKSPFLFIPALLILVLLSLPLASAANGCFLYSDSPSFCQEISKEQAQEECNLFNRCDTQKVFFENQFCNNQRQCQKILCKSSCMEEYLGQCPVGAAIDPAWCTPGCCQFEYFENKFCSYMPSKNRCVIEVQNRDVTEYRFSSSLDETVCEQSCAKGKLLSVEEETTELRQITPPAKFSSQEKMTSAELTKKITPPPSVPKFPPTPSQKPTSLLLILFPVTLLLVFIFFLFWKHAHRRQQTLEYEISEAERKKIPWFFPFVSHPWIKERIEQTKKMRWHKLVHHKREEFLAEQGLTPEKAEKPKEDSFRKLQKLAKKAKPEGKSPLQMLEEMGKNKL